MHMLAEYEGVQGDETDKKIVAVLEKYGATESSRQGPLPNAPHSDVFFSVADDKADQCAAELAALGCAVSR